MPHAFITCSSQLSTLTTVKNDSSRIRKKIRYTVGLAVRIFPITRAFMKDTHCRNMAGVQQGMCELARHGLGTAWYVYISLKRSRQTYSLADLRDGLGVPVSYVVTYA
jgi:hypothetical protein